MITPEQARIFSFRVVPDLPAPLRPLLEIAHNLWWSWTYDAVQLFRELDRDLWEESGHNPVKMLGMLDQSVLDRASKDRTYLRTLELVLAQMKQETEGTSWWGSRHADMLAPDNTANSASGAAPRIAYFSAEFGLTECLQIYSGGLGGLAGDHLKSASDLGLPLCGVGLLYRCGYFHQYLNADGWQQETYPDLDLPNQPIHRLIDPATGEQYRVTVELPGRTVTIGVWRCNVGRVPLYLLDTNFPENQRPDRQITRTLYGGDVEMRIKQEIVLGIGGVRALEKIGEKPTVCHINEGHAAFLALERIARLRETHSVDFDTAREAAAAQHLFTTHTPVPAGIDRFSPELVMDYLAPIQARLGIDKNHLLGLGRSNPFDLNEFFSMAILALRTSQFCNGVSRLHGEVSRGMWSEVWPRVPHPEVPIGHVTNGVHPRTWVAPNLQSAFNRYLGPQWHSDPFDTDAFAGIEEVPDEEIWRFRNENRSRLIAWARRKALTQFKKRGIREEEAARLASALDPNIFTIGFARRFATYKRGTLLMRDLARLKKILTNADRPVQMFIAGKSHPADNGGKELIRQIVHLAESEPALHRVVFLEDYDMAIARWLVQGCDIWLNTPKRGLEASGTSGMKAAMNGNIHVSILDGWWDEAYSPEWGYSIGQGETYDDPDTEDNIESRALYDLLERQILPDFYDRDELGVPRRWVSRIKASIRNLSPVYSTDRMVAQYAEQYYIPAHTLGRALAADTLAGARGLAQQIHRWRDHWHEARILAVESDIHTARPIRTPIQVTATVDPGRLNPSEIAVQLVHGEVTAIGTMTDIVATTMTHEAGPDAQGLHRYAGSFTPERSGRCGFAVRIAPRDERLVGTLIPGLMTWQAPAAPALDETIAHATPSATRAAAATH
ncbi:MAG: alpha-glucan family phosphorylase [Phycisphaerales bacterium]